MRRTAQTVPHADGCSYVYAWLIGDAADLLYRRIRSRLVTPDLTVSLNSRSSLFEIQAFQDTIFAEAFL